MSEGDPAERLEPQPWMTDEATAAVVAALTAGGADVRFVGGCVRDACLGRPVKDIDIGTPEPPATVVDRLARAGIKSVPTGIKHGTVTAVSAHRPFEITTLRRDVETDGRRAVVAFHDDWREDAARRDFTFNAMSCRPDGRLFDYFGGLADLRAGRVRFVGDPEQRIREDVLRLLRFFRFHAHYGRRAPDAAALAACRKLAPLLRALSGERLAQETLRLLAAPDPAAVVALMQELGVLAAYLPQARRLARLKAVVTIEGVAGRADAVRRLAALIEGGATAAGAVAERLRLSNEQRERLATLAAPPVALHPELGLSLRRRLFNRVDDATRRDLVLLAWAEAVEDASGAVDRRQAEAWRALLDDAAAWRRRDLPVKGRDVLALGVAPGPRVGELIDALTAWWEERDFAPDRKACLEELKRLLSDPLPPAGGRGAS